MNDIFNINGLGEVDSLAISNPIAGNDYTIAVTQGEIWLIEAFQYNFTASATVATRSVRLLYQSGLNVPFVYSQMNITASQSPRMDWVRDIETYKIATGNKPFGNQNFRLPLIMLDGDMGGRLFTTTSNIQAGDAFTDGRIMYRRWIK